MTDAPTSVSCATSWCARVGAAVSSRFALVTGPTTPGQLDREALVAATPSADALLWTRTDALGETTQGGITELLKGPEKLAERLGGLELAISPEAFFQTNTEMAERLYALAIEYAELTGYERVYDPLLRHRHHRDADGSPARPRCGAWRSSRRRSPTRSPPRRSTRSTTPTSSPVMCAWPSASSTSAPAAPTCSWSTPPRAGLSQKIVRRIIETAPKRIVYVSCNPTTLGAQRRPAGRGRV